MAMLPCIVPTTDSIIRGRIENFFAQNQITPQIIAETQDTALQKILAAKGDGIIFLPDISFGGVVNTEELVEIGELPDTYAEYYLIYGDRIIENPALDLVVRQDFETILY